MTIKRMFGVFMVLLAVVALVGFSAQAQGKGAANGDRTQARDGSCGNCPGYSDLDGDGVCDNAGSGDRSQARDGSCEDGSNYSDADGDGICDNQLACDGTQKGKRIGKLACDGTQQRKRIGGRK